MAISPTAMSSSPANSKALQEDEVFEAMAREASQRQVKAATQGFGFHSCALQIKDQKRSKWFYTQVLGMDAVKETESQ
jgi:catechol-2,3-dioxygenase